MRVTYTPSLMEQIRGNHHVVELGKQRPFCIFIRSCGAYVMQVDPKTQQTTRERQQFIRGEGDSLIVVPQYQWSEHPSVVEVNSWSVG